jgi:hypothetical protein
VRVYDHGIRKHSSYRTVLEGLMLFLVARDR